MKTLDLLRAKYSVESSLVMENLIRNLFGKHGHQILYEYGVNLSVALLQGKVLCMLHNTIKWIAQTTMNLCAIQYNQNVVNFLAEKVPETCLTIFNNCLISGQDWINSLHAVVPDFHAHQMTKGQQAINEIGDTSEMTDLFEVDSIYPLPTQYTNNNQFRTGVLEKFPISNIWRS